MWFRVVIMGYHRKKIISLLNLMCIVFNCLKKLCNSVFVIYIFKKRNRYFYVLLECKCK